MNTGTNLEKRKLPTLIELVQETELTKKQNEFMVLVNQPPPSNWLKEHPMAKVKVNGQNVPAKYLPRERVEYLLTAIFGLWRLEIKTVQTIANSVSVTVRLHVINPITHEWDWQDGVGAAPIQTDAGKGATDWNYVKSSGVQMAAPSAETYAFKDAAEKFGKIFGRDLNVSDMSYDSLLKSNIPGELNPDMQIAIDDCKSTKELNELWDKYPALHKDQKFIQSITTKRKSLINGK